MTVAPNAPAIDAIDRRILQLLQDEARMSFSEIGRQVHLSQPAVAERVHALEAAGVITGYHAAVDPMKLGYPIMAFIHVEARTVGETQQVIAIVQDMPEVLELHRITGRDGLILRTIVPSVARLNTIIQDIAKASAPATSIVLASEWMRRTV
jgi:Lrp/AsnC family transcriptional regulator, leucine-responsive regulatory protein